MAKMRPLAGADHLHVNGLRNKVCAPDASVIASARSLLTPMFAAKPCVAMPVSSSGQSVALLHDTYAALGSSDLIFASGGGTMGHPHGPAGGEEALRAASETALAGMPLAQAARESKGVAAALKVVG